MHERSKNGVERKGSEPLGVCRLAFKVGKRKLAFKFRFGNVHEGDSAGL